MIHFFAVFFFVEVNVYAELGVCIVFLYCFVKCRKSYHFRVSVKYWEDLGVNYVKEKKDIAVNKEDYYDASSI